MKKLWLGLLFAPALSFAQACPPGQYYDDCNRASVGPGACIPGCRGEASAGPAQLCIQDTCKPVTYFWVGARAIAESWLPNGYEVLGWAGPCLNEDRSQCPDIFNQAYADLRNNALRANRAQTFNSVE
jgi:hypothetical protein